MRSEYDSAMTRAGNVVVGAVGVFALLAAGCSNDESVPAATAVESTSVDTSSPPPATDPPATDPVTTVAATTTLDPATALAAEVEADFLEADRLGREASMDPFDDAKEAAALDRRLGVIRENFAATLAEYRTKNQAIRANDATPALITVEVPAALVVEGGDVVEMQICEVDSWVLVEVGAGPNGRDAIVNSDVACYSDRYVLHRGTRPWRFVDGRVALWDVAGGSRCAVG